jgi:hypothetical protein
MPLQPVHAPQPLLLAPPLLPPLVLRTENGFFGAKRPAIGRFGDCEPCTRFEEPPSRPPDDHDPGDRDPGDRDPDDRDPSGRDPGEPRLPARYVKHQLHEAVDLEGETGECVFAAYTGRVVEVDREAVRGNLTIDHHPLGAGLVSRYLHLDGDSICVEEDEPVTKGDLIARIGSGPEARTSTSSSGSWSTGPTGGTGPTGAPSPSTRRGRSTGSRPAPCRWSPPAARRP